MLTAQLNNNKKGFTLIELLVVIGILAVLLAIVLIAINPARQFAQANNTKRRSDVQAILNAIGAYGADEHGALPSALSAAADDTDIDVTDVCADIMPTYISALPTDPSLNIAAVDNCTGAANTGYKVKHDSSSRVTVSAPSAENSETIAVTR